MILTIRDLWLKTLKQAQNISHGSGGRADLAIEAETPKNDLKETKMSSTTDETLAAKLVESWDIESLDGR